MSLRESTPDALIPLRCAAYSCNALLDYAKANKLASDLPIIINLVYYHGKITPYPYSMDLLDLFSDKTLARRHLFTPRLIDVDQLSDDDISHHGLIAPAEFLFKRALGRGIGRKHIKSFVRLIKMHYNLGEQLPPIVTVMLKYGLELSDLDDKIFIAEVIKALPDYAGELMTTADQLRQQGAQDNARQMAINLLNNGVEPKVIAKSSNLTLAELKKLAKEAKNDDK